MEINILGLTAAITAFLSIWLGHVAVRKVEAAAHDLRPPIMIAIAIGLITEYGSLITVNRPLSTLLGILGVTLLWDAFELHRQEKRIKHGHAPANPNNPRHARFLADPNLHATTQDLLKREPGEA
jgi:hypothetical protein